MPSSSAIRIQVESALAHKIPSALTPPTRMVRSVAPTGIGPLDGLLQGGLPIGAMTEFVGEACSGRMSLALSFLARLTAEEKVGAWIDASNTFNPAAASAVGVDLRRLLWVRCGISETVSAQETRKFALPIECFAATVVTKGLHGDGRGTHPRSEVKGLSAAVDRFLQEETGKARCAEPIAQPLPTKQSFEPNLQPSSTNIRTTKRARPYDAVEQALRSADLLIQTGGFSAIILDLGEIPREVVSHIDLSTWHRYRVAAEQTQTSIVLLSQHACAKSSSELQLRLSSLEDSREEKTVFTGLNAHVEVLRQRFTQTPSNIIPMKKPPQSIREARWSYRASWVGPQ